MQKYLKSQAGFSHIAVIAAVVVTAGIVGAYTVVRSNASTCIQKTYAMGITGSTCVTAIQKLANWHNNGNGSGGGTPLYPVITVTSNFDAETKAAVTATQKYWGLQTKGVVDKKTWKVLCSLQYRMNMGGATQPEQLEGFPAAEARAAGCTY